MNILFICSKNPYPEKDGGCIAMNTCIKEAIKMGINVNVLAVNSLKNYTTVDDLPSDYKKNTHYESVFLDLKVKPLMVAKTYLSGKSPHVVRFYSYKFNEKLIDILCSNFFDFVMLESIFVCDYIATIRRYSDAKIVLRAHNVEFKIWERSYRNTSNLIKKILLLHVFRSLKRYELKMIGKVDMIAAITDIDAAFFKQNTTKPVTTLLFGFDTDNVIIPDGIKKNINTIFHLGSMDWQPNVDGINWFLSNVWNNVKTYIPNIKLHLAGKNMPDYLYNYNDNSVVIDGEVDDSKEYMLSKNIMIVPVLSGSGVRIKIIEAMLLGKVVVTTSIGAEGIACTHLKDIIIADTPEDFTAYIVKLINDEKLCLSISENAKITVVNKYNINLIYPKFIDVVTNL